MITESNIMSFISETPEEKFIRLLKYANAKTIKDYVIEHSSMNLHYPTVHLKTPLTVAIDRNDHQILALILERIPTKLDDTTTQPCGRTALMYSAFVSRNPEMLQVLLQKGADAKKTDIRGWTCLYYAVVGERLKNTTFLVKHDVEINTRDLQGRTPLMISAYLSNVNVLLCLLDHGADIYATDNNGYTVLMLAILWGKRHTTMVLLENCSELISCSGPELYKLIMVHMPNLLCYFEREKLNKNKENILISNESIR